eukprot:CAMPEP_0113301552 /NCGR_PEP_ID=MMETSP0010_2-20120614/2736_1 /TAXON_ID=216773 ORGANISM="Corethron hystrix, Strain 308" /NCGR_SAMPLE_ID=MMETSP0010_2 /ASSEMBLY_ACC=CAM_ASM_000155 /LENGTH=167 /DNA_ID=CAMNT_0000155199 /DNA_START=6 /DNA_END=506 /DNA_ORIENTATION=- /assembly_acc=CAM_ASM_000155
MAKEATEKSSEGGAKAHKNSKKERERKMRQARAEAAIKWAEGVIGCALRAWGVHAALEGMHDDTGGNTDAPSGLPEKVTKHPVPERFRPFTIADIQTKNDDASPSSADTTLLRTLCRRSPLFGPFWGYVCHSLRMRTERLLKYNAPSGADKQTDDAEGISRASRYDP